MRRGATGNPEPWGKTTGIKPRDLEATLAVEPASVQERWFSRLYALKPLIFGILGLFWIVTGIISLGPGWQIGISLLRQRWATGKIRSARRHRRCYRRHHCRATNFLAFSERLCSSG